MNRTNNYLIQARQAKRRFLTYDQAKLIRKLRIKADESFLYVTMLGQTYRINRKNADIERQRDGGWIDANAYEEVMTLLDLICDSRPDRHLSGRWKNMTAFGMQFHQNLLEPGLDPWAELFQSRPEDFRRACLAMGGRSLGSADMGYALELFDGLPMAIQLWMGDDEFPARLRYLWDENADMYIRYETMYFAKALLLDRIREEMDRSEGQDGPGAPAETSRR